MRLLGHLLAVLTTILMAPQPPAHAQPEPSFSATCGELRTKIEELAPTEEDFITIDVIGELTVAESDGVVAYMGMCEAPDPRVLCITYSVDDYKAGDRVVLTGTYYREDEDRVRLDPCLHYPPDSLPETE